LAIETEAACTYPWILEVADADYDETISSSKLVEQALKVFKDMCEKKNINTTFTAQSKSATLLLYTEPSVTPGYKFLLSESNSNKSTAEDY